MSSSHRRENPSRSAADSASASKQRNYRFKSYLEANTQERARFESMQDHVPDKIAEVIASFREEKLTVQPHRGPSTIVDIPDRPRKLPKPRPAIDAVALSPLKRRTQTWPWYTAVLVAALTAMIWIDMRSDVDQMPSLESSMVSASEDALTAKPGYEPVARAARSQSAVHQVSGSLVSRPLATSSSMKMVETSAVAAPVKKVAPPPTRTARSRKTDNLAEAQHYSEDLTGLLQGK